MANMPPHKYCVIPSNALEKDRVVQDFLKDIEGDWRIVGAWPVGSYLHYLLRKDGPEDLIEREKQREEMRALQEERRRQQEEIVKASREMSQAHNPPKPWEEDD